MSFESNHFDASPHQERPFTYPSNKRLWALFLLLGMWAWLNLCSAPGCHIWYSPPDQQSCDPQKNILLSETWKQAMAQNPRLTACLQVAWGERFEQATGVLVQLDDAGQLLGREGESDRFSTKQPVRLPPQVTGEQRRFRLFVFPPSFGNNQPIEEIDQLCRTTMASPTYDCLSTKEQETCWFFFAFRPEANFNATTPILQDDPAQSCRIYTRSSPQEALPEEALLPEEPSTPEEPKGAEESTPEEKVLPEEAAPPEEPIPEPQPEPPCAADPQIGQSCTIAGKLGVCSEGRWVCVAEQKTCHPLYNASPEICDRRDNNCNGKIDEGFFQVLTSIGTTSRTFNAVAIGPKGDIYVAGQFTDSIQLGKSTLHSQGSTDIVIARISPDGTVQWAVSGGGPSQDLVTHIAVDTAGRIAVMGSFLGSTTFGKYTLRTSANRGFFLLQLDNQGTFSWAQTTTGSGLANGKALRAGSNGQLFLAGDLTGSVKFGQHNIASMGGSDGFVASFDAQGQPLFAKSFGGEASLYVQDLALGNNALFLVGNFGGGVHLGKTSLQSAGRDDIFVARLDLTGTFQWAIRAGTENYESARATVFVQQGELVVAGSFQQKLSLGTITLTHTGNAVFVAGLDPNQGTFGWATKLGDQNFVDVNNLASDQIGDLYLLGNFGGILNVGNHRLEGAPEGSVYLARLDRAKRTWLWGTQIKPTNNATSDENASARGLAVEPLGHSYFVGSFMGEVIFGSQTAISPTASAAYLAKVSATGHWLCP